MHDSLLKQQQSTYDSDVQNQILSAAEANCVFQAPPQGMINRYMIELNNSLENIQIDATSWNRVTSNKQKVKLKTN